MASGAGRVSGAAVADSFEWASAGYEGLSSDTGLEEIKRIFFETVVEVYQKICDARARKIIIKPGWLLDGIWPPTDYYHALTETIESAEYHKSLSSNKKQKELWRGLNKKGI